MTRNSNDADALNLVDVLRTWTEQEPDRRIFTFLGDGENESDYLTYSDLFYKAQSIALRLLDSSPACFGERALLLYPPGLEFITAFFGCLMAGVIAVPAYPPDPTRLNRSLPRLRAILDDASCSIVLTTDNIFQMASAMFGNAPELASLKWIATDGPHERSARKLEGIPINAEHIAFLQYTSGSTASPKGVIVSHQNVLANVEMIRSAFGATHETLTVCWLPLYHDMGLIGNVITTVCIGGRAILMSPMHFLQRPSRWLFTISRYQATASGGPNFAYDLCARKTTREQCSQLNLRSWQVAFNGAEPVHRDTVERFAATFANSGFSKDAFVPCYGLAEATLMVSAKPPNTSPVQRCFNASALQNNIVQPVHPDSVRAVWLTSSGSAMPSQRVAIVDPETLQRCEANRTGEIWVSGRNVARGYFRRDRDTAETFLAERDGPGQPTWLRTGDVGFVHGGELFVTGRRKDIIIVRGRNHYPHDLERTVESLRSKHRELRPGCVAAFAYRSDHGATDKVAVLAEVDPEATRTAKDIVSSIRGAVAQHHQLSLSAVVLVQPRTIPKGSSGKLMRFACRDDFLSGALDIVAAWPERVSMPSRS